MKTPRHASSTPTSAVIAEHAKPHKRHPVRTVLLIVLGVLAAVVIAFVGYAAYLELSYARIPDNETLAIESPAYPEQASSLTTGQEYSAITYNVGFGAYLPNFSFFMDGGESSWADSPESCSRAIAEAALFVNNLDPTIALFQELDLDSTRSHHIDQYQLASSVLNSYYSDFAINYDSKFLPYPFLQPIGASKSGLATYTQQPILTAVRRSLPMADDLAKIAELDRCYTKSTLAVDNGKTLVVYNVHLIAYSSSGDVRQQQIDMLMADLASEVQAGNYVVCGGDFNSEMRDAVAPASASWALPFPRESLPAGTSLALDQLSDADKAALVDSNRDAGTPYDRESTTTYMLDAFIVSDNISLTGYRTIDNQFAYSDHMPVSMTFVLK